ncbi:MAG TPA: glucosyl-3-phosphoglycerate synthase [Kineosporiaceae bacterium]
MVADRLDAWVRHRTWGAEPGDVAMLRELLGRRSVSVIVPARNEEPTVGPLVTELARGLAGMPAEIVVVDDASDDGTAAAARAAGARVVRASRRLGKGGALRHGLEATAGEFVVFVDADVPDFRPYWVASLLLPLLLDEAVVLVKAAYDRPLAVGGVLHPTAGGRVTRLVAVPVLNLVAPELTVIAQPLAGETAVRRTFLDKCVLEDDYSVELALLLDAYDAAGLDGLAQVDLGVRAHRHHADEELGRMATDVLRAAARHAGWPVSDAGYAHVRRAPDGRLARHVHPPRDEGRPDRGSG